jgi:YHS domain-containing protein
MLPSAVRPGILPGSIRPGTAPAAREAPMAIEIDPVCGMEVDTTTSKLSYEHEGTTYWFCGKGCLLEFKDDPDRFLDPDYVPSM